jgi:hypothetical protein
VARPTILTGARRERIERELAEGIPVTVVAQNVGVHKSTVHSWLANGRVVRRPRVDPLGPDAVDQEFDLDARLRAAEPGLVGVILQAARRGSWQSAAWLLERSDPSRWARATRPPLVQGPGSQATDDGMEASLLEIDELRERRAKGMRRQTR